MTEYVDIALSDLVYFRQSEQGNVLQAEKDKIIIIVAISVQFMVSAKL